MRIHELEAELASTQYCTGEAARVYREDKEHAFAQGEYRKNRDIAAELQGKIKTYRWQVKEANEIEALNLAKFRKAQQELDETEERAKLAIVMGREMNI